MAELTLYRQDATQAGTANLKDQVFQTSLHLPLLHAAVRRYLMNQRQGTHKTKRRGEVSGGGKKPWKQKHTGRARQGSIRAPQWKGGGVVWGPQPRDYRLEMNQRERTQALCAALSAKAGEGSLVLLEGFDLPESKTKQAAAFLRRFQAEGRCALLVSDQLSIAAKQAARNIPRFCLTTADSLHPYHLLWADKAFLTVGAARKLEQRLA